MSGLSRYLGYVTCMWRLEPIQVFHVRDAKHRSSDLPKVLTVLIHGPYHRWTFSTYMTRDQKSGMGQTSGTQHWIETHDQPMSGSFMIFRGPTTPRTSHGNLAPNCSKGAWWLVNLTTAMVAEIIWMKSSGVLFHAMVWCKCDECHYAIKMQRFALTLGWARSKVYDHVGANI